jgi:hypothetical protein
VIVAKMVTKDFLNMIEAALSCLTSSYSLLRLVFKVYSFCLHR